jgi:hypothetical protein
MDLHPSAGDPRPAFDTPGAMLDALRDHPEWDPPRRDEHFDRLVQRFHRADLVAAAGARLDALGGPEGEAVLRLVEALGTAELLESLAEALARQPDLPAERQWAALELLDGAGLLAAWPELAGRWEELNEAIDEGGSLAELAAQLEDEPDGPWLALQGMGAVEPEVRAEIVAGLAGLPAGPGLVEFLRLLTFAHESATRAAAVAALEALPGDDPRAAAAWAAIAADHPDPDLAARARTHLGPSGTDLVPLAAAAPRLRRSLVTALDGHGRGFVVLAAEGRGEHAAAAFLCDVLGGVVAVEGQAGRDAEAVAGLVADFAGRPDRDAIDGVPELALGLLAGSLLLCGPASPPALRYWLERTAGPGLRPRPFAGPEPEGDPESLPADAVRTLADRVLDACPGWVDDSDLTYDLAEEILLRDGSASPDPGRDSGAYRYLFEHRLQGRLELYRRMLLWMAAFWRASTAPDLSRSALALAWQLSDAQHAVPGHPFTVALTTRSLAAAQADLRRDVDPRDPRVRSAGERGEWT